MNAVDIENLKIWVMGEGKFPTSIAKHISEVSSHVEMNLSPYKDEYVETMNKTGKFKAFPDVSIPENINITRDPDVLSQCNLILSMVPAQHTEKFIRGQFEEVIRENWEHMYGIISGTKGLVVESRKRISEVYQGILGEHIEEKFAAFAGPNFAKYIINGSIMSTMVASQNRDLCKLTKNLMGKNVFTHFSDDVAGVEYMGGLKNIIALAGGMAEGLGLDTNTIYTLLSEGAMEIVNFAIRMGAKMETFLMGTPLSADFYMTCSNSESRNYQTGYNKTAPQKLDVKGVAEGPETLKAIIKIAAAEGIPMPICTAISDMLAVDADVEGIINRLMVRAQKHLSLFQIKEENNTTPQKGV